MSNEKIVNGIYGVLEAQNALIFQKIAEKYDIDQDELTEFVGTVLTGDKTIKSVKLLARRPKFDKKVKNKSGYGKFSEENRPKIIQMLKDTPSERKFKNKKGETIVVSEADFQKGEPTFTHITQKCGALWAALSDKEKNVYNEKAKKENEERVSQSSTSTKGKKAPAKKAPAKKTPAKTEKKKVDKKKKDEEEEEEEAEAEAEGEGEEEEEKESEEKSRKKGSGRKTEKADKKKGGK